MRWNIDPQQAAAVRAALLEAVGVFVQAACRLAQVRRIALVGSLTTPKPDPKDADVLVTVTDVVDLEALAGIGRRLKGAAQRHNRGADIFLCSPDYRYLGRTCHYRECHVRVACQGRRCRNGNYLRDDLQVVTLSRDLLREPPIELWPDVLTRVPVPEDVARILRIGQGSDPGPSV
ncbi:MAG: hypothetical protein P4L83_21455 [Nevskia sp.]|nr:hypothetical protein [Nevskia sp.]